VLYLNGGLYADIKTEWIKDVKSIFPDPEKMYIVKSVMDHSAGFVGEETCYNGIIYSPPRNPIFLMLIQHILITPNIVVRFEYLVFCHFMFSLIKTISESGTIVIGYNPTIDGYPDVVCYEEVTLPNHKCKGTDRYGMCSFIRDSSKQLIIKTRYNDFPWKKVGQ
jgi:hypothetical protein